jgi:RNA polymerase sigma-70 factor (ECF subfamily)
VVRGELCDEAVRLGRLTFELLPHEPEVQGLLALMLLIDARREAREDAGGGLVRLDRQDRRRWDRRKIEEGQSLLRACLARNLPGPYQLQAAINAVHADAADAATTDWQQIRVIYDQWMAIAPGAVVALNRAVVVAEIEGPESALKLVDELDLANYHPFHAVRADLLRRLDRAVEAAEAYRQAIACSSHPREREFLERQLNALPG